MNRKGVLYLAYLWESMIAEFENYLKPRAVLNESDLKKISSHAVAKILQRNDFLFYEGEISRHKAFIVKGLLRTFGTSTDGNEHTLQFSPENTWTLDAESYDNQIPSRYNIEAVEESHLLLWSKTDFDQLLAHIPELKVFSSELISRAVHSSRQRLASALGATPEEKYTDFVNNSPDLVKRLPLRMIASYLGISLKTLTRIRHAQVHNEN